MTRDLPPTGRRAALRYRLAGALLLAVVVGVLPVRLPIDGRDLQGSALADGEGGGEGGGGDGGGDGDGGGGEGGDSDGGEGGEGSDGGDDGGGEGGDDGGDDGGEGGEGGEDGEGGDTGESGESGEDGDDNSDNSDDADRDAGSRRAVANELVAIGPGRDLAAAVAPLGISVVSVEPFPSLELSVARLRLPVGMSLSRGRALLEAQMPGIELDVNSLYAPMASVSLPGPDYARRMIGWPDRPDNCGAGLRIGMIDTPVDVASLALAHAEIERRSFLGPDERPAPPAHGTAIASILVGAPSAESGGLMPAAALFAAGVFSTDAKGEPQATAVGFVGALDWLVGEGVSAVNISLAGDDNDLVALAVEKAAAKGVALIASAGNGGRDAAAAYPAALDDVIAVTAVDADARRYPEANLGDYIDLAAPGVRVPAGGAPDGYATGTSFAAPFVTAVAATLAANLPADAAALDEALAAHSRDLGRPGRDPEFGWGLVQAPKVCGE